MYYVIYAVGCLPRVLLQQAGWLLGLWLYASRSQSRRVTEINVLRFFPDMTTSEREVLVRSSLIETARTALETPAVWFKNSKHLLSTMSLESRQLFLQLAEELDFDLATRGLMMLKTNK